MYKLKNSSAKVTTVLKVPVLAMSRACSESLLGLVRDILICGMVYDAFNHQSVSFASQTLREIIEKVVMSESCVLKILRRELLYSASQVSTWHKEKTDYAWLSHLAVIPFCKIRRRQVRYPYPSIVSLTAVGMIEAPTDDCFICVDGDGQYAAIKHMRTPNTSIEEETLAPFEVYTKKSPEHAR